MSNKEKILVVDDDANITKLCTSFLQTKGYEVDALTNPELVVETVKQDSIDLVLTDIKMPNIDGLEILRRLKKISPDIAVVVMTAYTSMEVAINALNDGAYSFIQKPFQLNELNITIKNALERKKLLKEIIRLKTLVNLFKVTEKINSTLEISELLRTMIKAVCKETNSEKAVVFYPDEETEQLYIRCAVGFNDNHLDQVRLPLKEGALGAVFNRKKSLYIPDIAESDIRVLDQLKDKAMLAIPMQSKERTWGVLGMFKSRGAGRFTEADKDIASILSSQASIAMENAELIWDLEILFLESMKSLANIIDERDPYTHGHSHRVS